MASNWQSRLRVTCGKCHGRTVDAIAITSQPENRTTMVEVWCHGERDQIVVTDGESRDWVGGVPALVAFKQPRATDA